jgi:hypothetical protein
MQFQGLLHCLDAPQALHHLSRHLDECNLSLPADDLVVHVNILAFPQPEQPRERLPWACQRLI